MLPPLTDPVNPRERFSAVVDDYDRNRPSYPEALVDWVLERAHPSPEAVVADLGSGTGISARLFARRGLDVVGIEPNDAMRERAVARGGARYVKGEAAATGLGGGTVALVIAAQAFHWFEIEPTLLEIRRILAPSGSCAVFWNVRQSTPFLDAYEALLRAEVRAYREGGRPVDEVERLREALRGRSQSFEEAALENLQPLDLEGFLGRVHSASYVAHGVGAERRLAFDDALWRLFDAHQAGGRVLFEYRSVVLWWRPEAAR